MKFLSNGYTGEGSITIGDVSYKVLLTSMDVSLKRNEMRSEGAMRYASSINSVSRTLGPYIQDYQNLTISMGFPPSGGLLSALINHLKTSRSKGVGVKFYDKDRAMDWNFGSCLVGKMSFSVKEHAFLDVSLELISEKESADYGWGARTFNRLGRLGENTIVPNAGVPYWSCALAWCSVAEENGKSLVRLKNDNFAMTGVASIDFTFSQDIKQMKGCGGTTSKTAPVPTFLVGKPSVELSYSRVMDDAGGGPGSTSGTQQRKLKNSALLFFHTKNNYFAISGYTVTETKPELVGGIGKYSNTGVASGYFVDTAIEWEDE